MTACFVIFVITLLGTSAAVDDKMKNKAPSAETTFESLIIASMLQFEEVVVAIDRLELLRVPCFTLAPTKTVCGNYHNKNLLQFCLESEQNCD
jgi:hypothetical protein